MAKIAKRLSDQLDEAAFVDYVQRHYGWFGGEREPPSAGQILEIARRCCEDQLSLPDDSVHLAIARAVEMYPQDPTETGALPAVDRPR
jgi:hypothetical protein